MVKATSESKTIVAAAVPLGLARELKNAAARSDRSVSAEIRRALARHLQRTTPRTTPHPAEPRS